MLMLFLEQRPRATYMVLVGNLMPAGTRGHLNFCSGPDYIIPKSFNLSQLWRYTKKISNPKVPEFLTQTLETFCLFRPIVQLRSFISRQFMTTQS